MAEVVDKVSPSGKYDWDSWADGHTRKFVRGVDFEVSVRSFANAARKAASFRESVKKVQINMRGQDEVFVTFILKNAEETEDV